MSKPLLLLFFFLTIIKTSAFACDCDGTSSFETEFRNSDEIFVGQVILIKPYKGQKKQKHFSEFVLKFKIDKIYKGTSTENIKVITPVAIACCGYPFEKGKTYLVYSFVNHNAYHVTYCSRTKRLNEAKEDIDKLNNLDKTGTEMDTDKSIYSRNPLKATSTMFNRTTERTRGRRK